jgi:hypothetical protein
MRRSYDFASSKGPAKQLALLLLVWSAAALTPVLGVPQADINVPPDATPQIQQINPDQAVPGAHVTVAIQGSNFSTGVYISAMSAAIHVDSSKRISATQIEAQLSISATAQPMTVSLLVSNPASRAAEVAFKIVAGQPPSPPAPARPATPEVPVKPPEPAAPKPPVAPTGEIKPSRPATPPAPVAPAGPPGPVVATVDPAHVSPGNDVDLKITGKNFATGVKVSFANTAIRVVGITPASTEQLTVHIKVARDAALGPTSLYVINPDDQEVEAAFEVAGKAPTAPVAPTAPKEPVTPAQPGTPPTTGSTGAESYPAFHLGSPTEVFETHGKVKGALVVSSGMLQYVEGGNILINISLKEIKEIKVSSIATATFHVTTTEGKTYHFAPGSLRPADARSMVDSLRKALPQ